MNSTSPESENLILVATCSYLDDRSRVTIIDRILMECNIQHGFEITVGILSVIVRRENAEKARAALQNTEELWSLDLRFYGCSQ